MAFCDLMFKQRKAAEAIARYAGTPYKQHNPHVGDGKQSFIDYFERMAGDRNSRPTATPCSSIQTDRNGVTR